MKKIIAINAGPRKGWNTDQLINATAKGALSNFVGPTEVIACGNTLQVDDYSQFNWTLFDPEKKKQYHDETFAGYLAKAQELGAKIFA